MLPNATLIIEIISFLILLYIMKRLLYRPFLDLLDRRARSIKEFVSDAEGKNKDAEERLKKAEEHLENVKRQALELKHEAKKDAEAFKHELMRDAKFEAERMHEYAKEDIAREANKVRGQLKKDISNIAVKISEKILSRRIDKDLAEKIAREDIQDIV